MPDLKVKTESEPPHILILGYPALAANSRPGFVSGQLFEWHNLPEYDLVIVNANPVCQTNFDGKPIDNNRWENEIARQRKEFEEYLEDYSGTVVIELRAAAIESAPMLSIDIGHSIFTDISNPIAKRGSMLKATGPMANVLAPLEGSLKYEAVLRLSDPEIAIPLFEVQRTREVVGAAVPWKGRGTLVFVPGSNPQPAELDRFFGAIAGLPAVLQKLLFDKQKATELLTGPVFVRSPVVVESEHIVQDASATPVRRQSPTALTPGQTPRAFHRAAAELDLIAAKLNDFRDVVKVAGIASIGHNGPPEAIDPPPIYEEDIDLTVALIAANRSQISNAATDSQLIVDGCEAAFAAFGKRLGLFAVWFQNFPESVWNAVVQKTPEWAAKELVYAACREMVVGLIKLF